MKPHYSLPGRATPAAEVCHLRSIFVKAGTKPTLPAVLSLGEATVLPGPPCQKEKGGEGQEEGKNHRNSQNISMEGRVRRRRKFEQIHQK